MASVLPQVPKPSVAPRGGPPGGEVTVKMTGLPAGIPLLVSFGALSRGYEILARTASGPDGVLDVKVKVPEWATSDDKNYFFVSPPDETTRIVSDPFLVTGPDGVLEVGGEISEVGPACSALRSDDGERVALLGAAAAGVASGSRVVVQGTVAEDASCGEGLVLRVRKITPR